MKILARRQGFAKLPEQGARRRGSFGAAARRIPTAREQRSQRVARQLRKGSEQRAERGFAFCNQAVSPGLDALKPFDVLRGIARCGGQRLDDRLQVDLAHQFADQLPLAGEPAMCADRACGADRIQQRFGEIQSGHDCIGERHESLTQPLSIVRGALAAALAGRLRLGKRIVREIRHLAAVRAAAAQCCAVTMRMMSQAVDATRIPELQEVVRAALSAAVAAGASAAEADASLQQGLSATVRLGEIETIEYQRDRGLGITVYFGHRKGSASTADLSAAAVLETAQKACAIARFTALDPCAGLADPALLARDIPQLELDYPWEISPDQAAALALRCESAGRAVDTRISNSEGGSVSTQRAVRVYGNTNDFLAGHTSSSHSISCVLLAADQRGMQRDYWYSTARDPLDLDVAEHIGQRAGERAVRRLGARRLTTRTAPVLFAPEVARGLFGHFVAAMRGGSQYRKASFLLGAAGQQVFPGFVQLQERPHLPKGLASSPFDGEGVATRDRALVTDGIAQGYVLSSYSARKLGLQSTGNAGGLHNLLVAPSRAGLDQAGLLREMGTGLLVTELMGQGVNGVTGDYSRGASGFWIEGGELAFPVEEVTVAGNLKDMFTRIAAIGNDIDERSGIRTGSVLVDGLTIAGE